MIKDSTTVDDWLHSPINSTIGTLWLGGYLRNKSHIPRHKMRILGRYALILIIDGHVFYQDALGRKANLSGGDVILVTPELAHAYGGVNHQIWSQSYVVFDGPQFDLLQKSEAFRSQQPFWKRSSIELWNERLKNILGEWTSKKNDILAFQTIVHFTQFLVNIMTVEAEPTESSEEWLDSSIRLLSNAQENVWLTPQNVATEVGLSYENFRKLFSKQMGIPPSKYQRERKIDRACSTIYRGSTSFKALAEELDFCDIYHFSKVFRQVKGMSPSDYRRSVRGE